MMTEEGSLEIFRYTRRYVVTGYRTKSLRCGTCVESPRCDGLHINTVRAHGYAWMRPLPAQADFA
jgi:CDGSH-type Zn-finger protein